MEAISRRSGEVRRIHIVYFLCRNGAIEQPHLVRIHHHHHRGVRLRDVKRWLSELRGHDMPHSFAWSYKRRYRGGSVWQDLTDDDLITPISDNEYVLKGSLLPSQSKTMDPFASNEKRQAEEEEEMAPETLQMDGSISPKPPPHSDEQSPLRAPLPQTPLNSEEKKNATKSRFFRMSPWQKEEKREKEKSTMGDVVRKGGNEVIRSDSNNVTSAAGSQRQATKSIIRNLIGGCMLVETKNSGIRIVQHQQVEEF